MAVLLLWAAPLWAAGGAPDSVRAVPEPFGPTGGRLVGRFEFGFDSFEEHYSIVEEDTVNSVNEWRARVRLGYAVGSLLRNYFIVEGHTFIGKGDYETAGRVRFTRQLRNNIRSRFSVEGEVMRRTFNDNTDYSFPNDYWRGLFNGYLRLGAGNSFSVRIGDRLETTDFAQRTEFDYDYTRNSVILSAEYDRDLATAINGGLRYTRMSVPDSTEIEYESWTPVIEFRSSPELRRLIYFQGALERRLYGPNPTRSSFWGGIGILNVEWAVAAPVSAVFEDNLEVYDYDVNTTAYFDYVENRLVALVVFYPSWYSRFGAGPSWGLLRSDVSAEDEYNEYGVVARAEYNRGARLWAQLQYELGERSYPAYDPSALVDLTSVYSDFIYHRLSAFLNWRIAGGFSLNLFADYQPQDHDRKTDDSTATLFSVGLAYIF